MEEKIRELIGRMTLEEKAAMCSGADAWSTMPIERLGIPSVHMTDGPHGVRKENNEPAEDGGLLTKKSDPSVCYPTASALACSWNPELARRMGEALGEECLAAGISILLGPGMNIKRSPLCGRNFEYFSEDPLLAGKMGAAIINGVQSKGIGTSLKHFAANSQETRRMTTDSAVDERTLREIYLTNFEIAVKTAQPWTVMSAYNRLRGTYCSENETLLTGILRKEWGFEGIVISDWGAINEADDSVCAGLDLEMPAGGKDSQGKILAAVKSGKLSEKQLDETVARLLKIILRAAGNLKKNASFSLPEHEKLAGEIARESMVLLKNDGVLPLQKSGKIAVIGSFAKKPHFQGGGSSQVNPTHVSVPLDEIRKAAGTGAEIVWCEGYSADGGQAPDETKIEEAVRAAETADTVILFVGLPLESEGFDRKDLRLPEGQLALIDRVTRTAAKTAVVLMNGSPVEMPWAGRANGILEAGLCGQEAGGAIADILFGNVNPSGKLAETFPVKLSDTPAFLNYPAQRDRAEYREGIFVGYRYYDKKQLKPLFPFGHGLSYTTFAYTGIETDKNAFTEDESLTVRVRVKNTGSRAGRETVQLYVRDVECCVPRPEKELKGFAKVLLQPGEEKEVSFALTRRAFAFYDTDLHDWRVESGEFEILAGGSSANTPLKATVTVSSRKQPKIIYSRNSTIGEVLANPAGAKLLAPLVGAETPKEPLPSFALETPLRCIHMQTPEFDEDKMAQLIDLLNSGS